MKYLRTITAVSVLTVSAFANAEISLSQSEMDGVNAGGFAVSTAVANALGVVTSAFTDTVTNVISTNIFPAQLGAVFVINSDALAAAASDSDGSAVALATATGATQGTGNSDTTSDAQTYTDTSAVLPFSMSYATNTSLASTIIIGDVATASSAATSGAFLSN